MHFKPSELVIDPANPFAYDAFERQEIVGAATRLITGLTGPFVIAIDSEWGTGKTTFIRMLKVCLEAEGHPCLYFNAWETDFAEDPLIAFVGELDGLMTSVCPEESERRALITKTKKITSAVAKRAAPALLKLVTLGAVDLQQETERILAELAGGVGTDAVEHYLQEKAQIEEFHKELGAVLEAAKNFNKKLPVVIFVDELDRCRPLYAIELLERIKHLFNVEQAVFVVAVDKEQLGISLGAVYGHGFNSTEYLRRFFDLELKLSAVDSEKYCDSLMKRMELDELFKARPDQTRAGDIEGFRDSFRFLSKMLGLTPRAQEQYMGLLKLALVTTPDSHHLFPVETSILAALKISNSKLYHKVSRQGGSVSEVIQYLNENRTKNEPLKQSPIKRQRHYWAVVQGYLLSMRRDADQSANLLLAEHGNNSRDSSKPTEIQEEGYTVTGIASQRHGWPTANLDVIGRRIDVVAQFSNER
jgi:hypothetical protein